jgi:photosystem II stability/assembly factor-like uncharacterized protein
MNVENPVYKLISIPALDAADSSILIAAKASGLEFSSDGGEIWQNAYLALGVEAPLGTFAVDAVFLEDNQVQVFAGLSGGILFASFESGFQDFSWQKAHIPSPPPLVTDFVISPNFLEEGLVLAATLEDGVLRSTDHGKSWTGWNFNLLDRTVLCLEISPPLSDNHTVFAGTESGLFRSVNGGKSWREILLPFGNDPILSMALSHNYGEDGCLWISSENHGLWFSDDHGIHWEAEKDFSAVSPLNSVQIFRGSAGEQQIAVMSTDWIKYRSLSDQTEHRWAEFQPGVTEGHQLMALCAPSGIGPGRSFWVGFSDGQILKYTGKS